MLYICGDTHGDFKRFTVKNFPNQNNMTKDDIVIILGDFGGIWDRSKEEIYWLDWLSKKNFTICYVDGNHENFSRYYDNEFETIDFYGGKAHKIRDNIFHLMRGYIFDFEDKKFFCMGGASSHDISDGILDEKDFDTHNDFIKTYKLWNKQRKMFRVNNVSWWKEEIPSSTEMELGIKNLESLNYEVDFVISHCLPNEIASNYSHGFYKSDSLTIYFDTLLRNGLKFNDWYCGHYHDDKDIMGKFHIRYFKIERIL